MRPLKLMLVMEATDGGTARYLEEVSIGLSEVGINVHVACAARRNPRFRAVLTRLQGLGIQVTEVDMRREVRPIKDAQAIRHLWCLFRRANPDVIHLHSSKAGALGRVAARLAGIRPVIYTPHAFAFLDDANALRAWCFRLAERILGSWTNYLVAVSESERHQALVHQLLPNARISVVPNGVAHEGCKNKECVDGKELVPSPTPSVAETMGHSAPARSKLWLGYLGRLERQKDPIQLIHLAAAIKHRGVDFHLDIGGTGSLRAECERLCEIMALRDHVRFLGYVTDTAAFYRSIDVFTLTSRYEGLPYTVLDAMSWGLPVAAFDVAGVNDAVVSGETGFLAVPGAVAQLADYIIRLAGSPVLRSRMGEAGRERVAEHFRLDHQLRQLQSIYETIKGRSCASHPSQSRACRGFGKTRVNKLNHAIRDGRRASIRVLYVCHCGDLGGAERSLLELLEETRLHGVEPLLVCPARSDLAEAADAMGINALPMPLRRIERSGGAWWGLLQTVPAVACTWAGLFKTLKRRRVDLVHANSTVAHIWVGVAARLARVPCVWHWRDFYDIPRVNRMLARTASLSVAISRPVCEFASGQLRGAMPLVTVRNGVKDRWVGCSDTRKLLRGRWGVQETNVVVGMMGQAVPRKGHDVLIRAMGRAVAREPLLRVVFHYLLLDDEAEHYVERLRKIASDVECQDTVTFAGPADDVVAALSAFDIVVVPSLREPFGRTAVEAMLAEKPVVGSAVDGLAEIIFDGRTGLLFPPGDWRHLADALLHLAANPDIRREMGRAGRKRALEYFSVRRMATEIVGHYRCLVPGVDKTR